MSKRSVPLLVEIARFATLLCFAAGVLSAYAALASEGPAPKDTIRIENASDNSQKDYPFQFGRPFVQREIPHSPQVLVDGAPVLTQADVKNRYADGSVKFAVISILVPSIPTSGTITLSFRDQPTGNNTPLSASQMLDPAFDFDAQIVLQHAGVTQSTSARDMLKNGNFTYWTKGPLATTVILADHSAARKYDMGFDSLRPIRPIFEATFWPSLHKVDVRVAGEDANTETLEDVDADLRIELGIRLHTVYTKPDLVTYAATRWNKEFWIGGAPEMEINIDHNLAYLVGTRYFPNFDSLVEFSEAYKAQRYGHWEAADRDLYDKGLWVKSMPAAGGRCDIGHAPCWMMWWLYTGDWRTREVAIGQADLADAWPLQVREGDAANKYDRAQKTDAIGRPISIFARPKEWLLDPRGKDNRVMVHGERVTRIANKSGRPLPNLGWEADGAHQPDPFSIPYILTGKHWYLEEMQLWAAARALQYPACAGASYCVRSASPVVAGIKDETRGKAWVLRNRAHAALFSPDGTPEQAYFKDILNDAIAVWEGQRGITDTFLKDSPAWKWGHSVSFTPSPLHFFDPIEMNLTHAPQLFVHGNVHMEPLWMAYFLMIELGHVKELGYPTGPLLDWLAPVLTAQFQQPPPYDPHLVAAYNTPLDTGPGTPPLKTWLEVYSEYGPGTFESPVIKQFGRMSYYPIVAATAGAMVAGEPGGNRAWQWLDENIRNNPDARTDKWYHDEPQWNIVPRH